jgi:hypothetical protein
MEREECGERCPQGKVILIACMSAKSFAAGVMGVTQTGSLQQMDRFQLNENPSDNFFFLKKNRIASFVGSVCRAVPVFSLADLSFIYVLLAGRFSSFTRRSTVSADRISR